MKTLIAATVLVLVLATSAAFAVKAGKTAFDNKTKASLATACMTDQNRLDSARDLVEVRAACVCIFGNEQTKATGKFNDAEWKAISATIRDPQSDAAKAMTGVDAGKKPALQEYVKNYYSGMDKKALDACVEKETASAPEQN